MPKPLDKVLEEAIEHREDNLKKQFPVLDRSFQIQFLKAEAQRLQNERESYEEAIQQVKRLQELQQFEPDWLSKTGEYALDIVGAAGILGSLGLLPAAGMALLATPAVAAGVAAAGVASLALFVSKHWTNGDSIISEFQSKIDENKKIQPKVISALEELTGISGGDVKIKTKNELLQGSEKNVEVKIKKISTKGETKIGGKSSEGGVSSGLGTVEPVTSTVPPKPQIDIPPTPKPSSPNQENLNVSPKTENSKQKENRDKMNGLIEEIAKLQAIQANPDINTNPEQTKRKLVSAQEELISLYYKTKYPDSDIIDPEIVKKDPELKAYVDSIPKNNVTMKDDDYGMSFSLSGDDPTRKKAREDLVIKLIDQIKQEQNSSSAIPSPTKEPEKKQSEVETQAQSKKELKQSETTTPKVNSGTKATAKIPEGTKKKNDSEVFYPRSTMTLDDLINKSPGFKERYVEPKEETPVKEPNTVKPKEENPTSKSEAEPVKKKEQEKVSTVEIKTGDGKVKTKSSNDIDYNPAEIRSLIMQLASMKDSDMEKLMEQKFQNEQNSDVKRISIQAGIEELKIKKKMADTYLTTQDPTTKKDIEKWFASMVEGVEAQVKAKSPKETKPSELIEPPAPKTAERMDKEVSAETSSSDRRSNEELNVVRSSLVEDKMASRDTTTTPMVIPIPMAVSGRGGGNTTEAQYNTIPLLVVNDEEVIRMNSFEASKLRMV